MPAMDPFGKRIAYKETENSLDHEAFDGKQLPPSSAACPLLLKDLLLLCERGGLRP